MRLNSERRTEKRTIKQHLHYSGRATVSAAGQGLLQGGEGGARGCAGGQSLTTPAYTLVLSVLAGLRGFCKRQREEGREGRGGALLAESSGGRVGACSDPK